MLRKPFYKNIHFILPVTAVVTETLLFFVFVYINSSRLIPVGLTAKEYWRENWLILLQFYAITYFVYYSITFFNNRYKNNQNTAARFINEILFICLAGFVLQEIFRTLFIKVVVVPEASETLDVKLRMLQMVNVTAILVQYSFMTSLRIYKYLQQKQFELVKWQKEYTQSQFEALKNRLNPHFLFNSLSVLTSLVYVDANLAEEFIEKLSKTYRYLLEQRDKERIEVSKEIEFVQSYIFLLQQRFGKKLKVTINESNNPGCIIPHSLLIAMENIVLNNTMSSSKPLCIDIRTNSSGLLISYNSNPKTTIEKNSVEQLHHLQERYQTINPAIIINAEPSNEEANIQFPFI